MKTNKTFGTAIVGALLLIGVSSAQAASVRIDPTDNTNALGIDNIILSGLIWNVNFDFNVSNFVHGPLPPFEVAPEELHTIGLALTDVVNDVLNTEPGVNTVGPSDNKTPSFDYAFAQDRGTAIWYTYATVGEYAGGQGWILGDGDHEAPSGGFPGYDLIPRDGQFAQWALYEFVAPVPIPGAVWLLGGGLIGLVGLRRKLRN
jgi:hypothetical protein